MKQELLLMKEFLQRIERIVNERISGTNTTNM